MKQSPYLLRFDGGVEIAARIDLSGKFHKIESKGMRSMKWTFPQVARLPLLLMVVLMWGLLSQRASAAQSPLEVIRMTTKQALAVLKDPAYQGAANRQARIKKMWEVILPSFDEREIAQRALGLYWRERTKEQRTHFTQLFIQLVKNSYSSTLDRYTKDAKFFFDKEHIDGDYAEVYTRIQTPAEPDSFHVVYRLHRVGGQWLVYDVVAENVSLVRNYRNQFYRIINHSSFDGLITALKDKLKELGISSQAMSG